MKRNAAVAFQALTEIAIIAHLAETSLAQTLPPELSLAGFGVLNHFARLGIEHDSPAKLARAFQVTKGAMTYTLQSLQEAGYVSIGTDPKDARVKIVRVTAAGKRAREHALVAIAPRLDTLLQTINGKAFAGALPFLTDLRTALDAQRD